MGHMLELSIFRGLHASVPRIYMRGRLPLRRRRDVTGGWPATRDGRSGTAAVRPPAPPPQQPESHARLPAPA